MLALAELERHVHGRCGMPLEDVLDPDADGDPITGRQARFYVPETPLVCHYCAVRDDRVKADHERYPDRPHQAALIWPVRDRGRNR